LKHIFILIYYILQEFLLYIFSLLTSHLDSGEWIEALMCQFRLRNARSL